jgi:hypothetical protein
MYATLFECSRIVGLLQADDVAGGRRARDLHEELRRVLAGVGVVAARPSPPPTETAAAAPLASDRARQARIQRAWSPTTTRRKTKT